MILLFWLGLIPVAAAQPAPFRYELLNLLPADFAVCVVMHDLRGHSARWEKSDWRQSFRASPLGKAVLNGPEMLQFEHLQSEMRKNFNLDWPTLRDDLLGDTLLLAYSPGAKNNPDDERGLILLHTRKPDRLRAIIEKINDAQKKSGELKLTEWEHKGNTYYRRIQGNKTQFYFIKGSLVAVATKEEIIRDVLDQHATPARANPWAKRFQKAGADSAFLIMCVNPRRLDAEILRNNKKDDPLPRYWRALEAIFVSFSVQDEAELRLTIQADAQKLPEWATGAFMQTSGPSTLWQRFPERSILTVASKTDFSGAGDALKLLMSAKDQRKLMSDWKGTIGAVLRLELFKDLLPNIGPDWGVCVLPSRDEKQLPHALFALAVKPGAGDEPVDQTLFKAVELGAGFAVLKHNDANPDSIIRIESVRQDKVRVLYLRNDKLFPPGYQPACALKDGFLLFATSPAAVASFRLRDKQVDADKGTPLARISAPELANLLAHRREHILSSLTEQKMPPETARKNLENMVSLLGLFDHLTLSQRGGDGQASWSIRLAPAPKSK